MLRLIGLLIVMMCPIFALAQGPAGNTDAADPAQRMPLFISDCPEGEDQRNCAERTMLQYIYSNLRYPAKARRHGVEGLVVVSFIIERDGTVSNIQILRDLGAGTGKEVKRIVEKMNRNGPSWLPGKQDGEIVRVQFNLPVQFNLDDSTSS